MPKVTQLVSKRGCKKLINRNLCKIEFGDQKGELPHPVRIAEPNRERKDFFSGNNSANEKPWALCLL